MNQITILSWTPRGGILQVAIRGNVQYLRLRRPAVYQPWQVIRGFYNRHPHRLSARIVQEFGRWAREWLSETACPWCLDDPCHNLIQLASNWPPSCVRLVPSTKGYKRRGVWAIGRDPRSGEWIVEPVCERVRASLLLGPAAMNQLHPYDLFATNLAAPPAEEVS